MPILLEIDVSRSSHDPWLSIAEIDQTDNDSSTESSESYSSGGLRYISLNKLLTVTASQELGNF